jgi:hypothetical protein
MEIILPVRKGGLGNQLFQVAAGIVYGKETGKTVVLPREQHHIHKVHKPLYEESIFQGFQILNGTLDENGIYNLCQNGFSLHPSNQEKAFEPWSCDPIQGNVVLHGYFQYAPPLLKHKDLISSTFLKNLQPYRKEGKSTHIAIHVRRGDYLQFPDVYPILDCSYYIRAIQEVEKRVPGEKLYKIFSDDILWCRDQDMFQSLPNVEFVDERDEIKALCLMIACKGGCICANSSFSWWGAFLGAFQNGAPCIVPGTWCKGFTGELIPKEWITVPVAKGSIQFFEPGTLNLHHKKDVDNIIKPLQKPVEIYIDSLQYSGSSNYKIFLQMEPVVIKNMEEHLVGNWKLYDKIYSFNETVLKQCGNAVKVNLPACSWISGDHFHHIDTSKKQFQISCITGAKQMAEGHTFRLLLYFNQNILINECRLPIIFYRSSAGQPLPELSKNPFIQKDKFDLFETYQYSLVIENSSQQHYFTEKLIDCLITKTIPIYYGCPNIADYFDTTGWILLTNLSPEGRLTELVQKWQEKAYTPSSYETFAETVEKNYQTCKKLYPGFYNTFNKLFLELESFA